MKKLGFFLLICLSCRDASTFTIYGQLEKALPKSKVYLYRFEKNRAIVIDSTVLSEKGEFKFSTNTPEIDLFKIAALEKEYVVIAKNGDNIKLSADLSNKEMTYVISGAAEAEKLQELNVHKNKYAANIARIEQQYQEILEREPKKREIIQSQMKLEIFRETKDLVDFILKFSNNNPEYLASYFAINSLNPNEYEKELIQYSERIKGNLKYNSLVMDFLIRMAKLKSVQVGQIAPDFTISSIDGKPLKISEFKGKYLLLDFWASWCMPCRIENPYIVKTFKKYQNKNFAILGISLDTDIQAWRQAIVADKLTWNHGGELSDFNGQTVKLYQVESIPTSFLIDPSGKIVAKNLRGDDLDKYLSRILN